MSVLESNKVYMLLDDEDTFAGQLLRALLRSELSPAEEEVYMGRICAAVSLQLDGNERSASRYTETVRRFVEELRQTEAVA